MEKRRKKKQPQESQLKIKIEDQTIKCGRRLKTKEGRSSNQKSELINQTINEQTNMVDLVRETQKTGLWKREAE